MQAAGAAMSYVGEKQAAKSQEDYQNRVAQLQLDAAARQQTEVHIKESQEREITALKMREASQEADKLAAQSRLMAAERGITGQSASLAAQAYEAQEGAYVYSLLAEQEDRMAQAIRTQENINIQAHQQITATKAPVSQPNLLATVLSTGAQMAGSTYSWGVSEGHWGKDKKLKTPDGPKDLTGSTDPDVPLGHVPSW